MVYRTCKTDSEIMRNVDWRITFPYRCYFYPGRDCPGWDGGGICGRIGRRVPLDAEASDGGIQLDQPAS
jgi:hypothetical protein